MGEEGVQVAEGVFGARGRGCERLVHVGDVGRGIVQHVVGGWLGGVPVLPGEWATAGGGFHALELRGGFGAVLEGRRAVGC